jgi:multiple sugar transport system ATP-binding protein
VASAWSSNPMRSIHACLFERTSPSACALQVCRRRRSKAASSAQHRCYTCEKLLDRRPAELSGGQRQRVAIGRALVREVDVFLFDEPLSNLDAKLSNELRVEIKRLHQQLGNTMIYVTHDQVEALTLADRIAIMKEGVIQQLGTPAEIYHRPTNLFVAGFIGAPAMNFLAGNIEKSEGALTFRTADLSIDLSGYAFQTEPTPGPATFGVRPEQVSIRTKFRGSPVIGQRLRHRAHGFRYGRLVQLGGKQPVTKGDGRSRSAARRQDPVGLDISKASLFGADGNRL